VGEKKRGKNLMGQDKSSLIKQKLKPCAETKANKTRILYFPSASNVQPLSEK